MFAGTLRCSRRAAPLLGLAMLAAFGVVLSAAGSARVATRFDATPGEAPVQTMPSTTKVLFMCPHGAAKSVLASAYFQRLAKERGLDVRVDAAGIDPDPVVGPAVAAHLTKNGYQVPIVKPRRVNADDLAAADVVISLGCDMTGLPAPRRLQAWNDVPGPGEDFNRSEAAIRRHVIELVDELIRLRDGK